MRFYVPEWEDAVDAHYDYIHDEHSALNKTKRERHFIWDIFDYESTPIDGVLVSREQAEGSQTKFDRITEYGVYNDPQLNIPNWLPTISDCGAWGYKSLPFPPYGNANMLDFYEKMDVDVGVTIDHLVLGSGKEKGRLYLDKRAFRSEFGESDLPPQLTDKVDVMIEEWPSEWPDIVSQREPSICNLHAVDPFTVEDFEGSTLEILQRMDEDHRAVYREDDKWKRYEMTLENARKMGDLYQNGDWSFRLMAAFQGWNPTTYGEALDEVLKMGYQYVGIGGVAGSQLKQVEEIVTEVGHRITEFESEHETRIDTHVFGFAKTDGFETIGRAQMSSIDSASMLRAAWTGGNNYHLNPDERFDAIRVRYAKPGDALEIAVKKSMLGQEVLHALRAFDDEDSISSRIRGWYAEADLVLDTLVDYLEEHRHDERYDARLLREVTSEFRDDFDHGYELQASFSDDVRKSLVKLLRADDADDPTDFDEYLDIISIAREVVDEFPRTADRVEALEEKSGEVATFKQIWTVLESYATSELIDDEDLLEGYRETLRSRPWDRCDCPICEDLGIEVAIFRGNNRNRRRGFHNTYRFYQKFKHDLPKMLVVVPADSSLFGRDTVEEYLSDRYEDLWEAVHDVPVAEIGVLDANGVHEWSEPGPTSISLDPIGISEELERKAGRYDTVLYYDPEGETRFDIDSVEFVDKAQGVRDRILQRLGYESDFTPSRDVQIQLEEF
ncbi:queuine tRNA-ribosyltransferase tRNA-guanine transglycosylase [Halorubrum sp. 2020YC2]|uniref:queuine tRNA-ribosyltransferase tRNA-guanine transglycosylase n=1 Tax=Halorubrum sp. 2020YC2 TaxID=2836432 RepID=UPI001BE9AE8A|nr:queuine tRNA-ribosyltransferase tRNA-guanine transglycosylase [Halorubrum sp. 2020YC2]QWC20740.1 queuine tRNA-ribosyltransferase tRNA-guanine transglycosylase [Halorubrum sp. 2020YC2]